MENVVRADHSQSRSRVPLRILPCPSRLVSPSSAPSPVLFITSSEDIGRAGVFTSTDSSACAGDTTPCGEGTGQPRRSTVDNPGEDWGVASTSVFVWTTAGNETASKDSCTSSRTTTCGWCSGTTFAFLADGSGDTISSPSVNGWSPKLSKLLSGMYTLLSKFSMTQLPLILPSILVS